MVHDFDSETNVQRIHNQTNSNLIYNLKVQIEIDSTRIDLHKYRLLENN